MRYKVLVDILKCRYVCKISCMTNNCLMLYILCEKCYHEWWVLLGISIWCNYRNENCSFLLSGINEEIVFIYFLDNYFVLWDVMKIYETLSNYNINFGSWYLFSLLFAYQLWVCFAGVVGEVIGDGVF